MKTLAKSLTLALATAGLAATAAAPAFAAEPAPRTALVSYADINLSTAAGQRTLDKRIEKAARSVCRQVSVETGTRIMNREVEQCLARARTEAKQQVAARISNEQRGG